MEEGLLVDQRRSGEIFTYLGRYGTYLVGRYIESTL